MDPGTRPTSGGKENPPLVRVIVASKRDAVMSRLRAGLSEAPDFLVLGPPAMPPGALLGTAKIYQPDVLVLGQRVLRSIGERAVEQLVDLPSRPRVLLLSDKPQSSVAGIVLKHRFYGYIGSDEEIRTLVNAVRCVFRGELWVPRSALADALYGPLRTRAVAGERRAP
jgi:DNA-binding NarL/FixJ family response regulator